MDEASDNSFTTSALQFIVFGLIASLTSLSSFFINWMVTISFGNTPPNLEFLIGLSQMNSLMEEVGAVLFAVAFFGLKQKYQHPLFLLTSVIFLISPVMLIAILASLTFAPFILLDYVLFLYFAILPAGWVIAGFAMMLIQKHSCNRILTLATAIAIIVAAPLSYITSYIIAPNNPELLPLLAFYILALSFVSLLLRIFFFSVEAKMPQNIRYILRDF